jgi:hypothetical protein
MEQVFVLGVAAIVVIAVCEVIRSVQCAKSLKIAERGNELYQENIRVAERGK